MKHALVRAITGVLLAAAPGAVFADGPPPQPTHLSEVVVVGGPGPKVVQSFPGDGAEVAAGVLVVKIVFDHAMASDGWSYGRSDQGEFPLCLAQPRLLGDNRTFALLCSVAANRKYAIAVNPGRGFVSADGRAATPVLLRFSTTETGPRGMHEALLEAGLTDADEPIMSRHDDAGGAAISSPSSPLPGP